jgi:protein disulfide-isomerase A6
VLPYILRIFMLCRVSGLLAIFVTGCYALYPSSSEVVDLTPANFDRLVIQSDAVWIVEFFAPWCGHCQQFVPEYSKAATALKVM